MRKKRTDRNHIIYQITCEPTNECYIGVTVVKAGGKSKTLKQRWQGHIYKATILKEKWTLSKAIRKYGQDNFTISLVDIVRGKKEAFMTEAILINKHKTKLNTRIKN